MPDLETDFVAARNMNCSKCGNDDALIIRGRIDSQCYSSRLSRGPEYKRHHLKIIIEGKEIKLDNFISHFYNVFQGSGTFTVSAIWKELIYCRYHSMISAIEVHLR
jgi:hypothetical protein